LLGIVGIKDPIRPETREAVRLLRGAGVVVRMVTGDNVLTATAIAREAGILVDGEEGLVLEGPVFRKMSQKEKESVAVKIRVLARSSPADKLTLVNLQKALGEVVSVSRWASRERKSQKKRATSSFWTITSNPWRKPCCGGGTCSKAFASFFNSSSS
jgi:hypothetical protein